MVGGALKVWQGVAMDGDGVIAAVMAAVPGAVAFAPGLRVGGAYAVVIGLARPVAFARGGVAGELQGWLVYAGSAYGPGGIGARVGRHLRRDKAAKWHVDALTGAADWLGAVAVPGGRECDVVAALLARSFPGGGFETALAGFGSSDCRVCAGHLLHAKRSLINCDQHQAP